MKKTKGEMTMFNKANLERNIKSGLKLWFGLTYWLFFGSFIMIGWIAEGIGLAIVLSILFGTTYWFIVKMVRFFIRKNQIVQG